MRFYSSRGNLQEKSDTQLCLSHTEQLWKQYKLEVGPEWTVYYVLANSFSNLWIWKISFPSFFFYIPFTQFLRSSAFNQVKMADSKHRNLPALQPSHQNDKNKTADQKFW